VLSPSSRIATFNPERESRIGYPVGPRSARASPAVSRFHGRDEKEKKRKRERKKKKKGEEKAPRSRIFASSRSRSTNCGDILRPPLKRKRDINSRCAVVAIAHRPRRRRRRRRRRRVIFIALLISRKTEPLDR